MKILYHHRVLSKDGQDVHIEEMLAAFRRRGHTVTVVAPPMTENASFGSDGGTLSRLRAMLPRAVSEFLELLYSIPDYRRLKAAWAKAKPDVLYERHNLFLLSGYWLKRRTGIPYLLEVNAPLYEERKKHSGIALGVLARGTENRVWRSADVALPVTQVLAERLERAGVSREKISVIPNGVNLDRFTGHGDRDAVRRELGISASLILGFTGFMRDWHDLTRVATILAQPWALSLHFLVVGDGPARASLEAEAARLGVSDRLTILGIIPRDRVNHYVTAFDIALQPRVVDYASPLKLFEYMALGLAIVAPDTPNICEILRDGENALLFPLEDEQAFSERLQRLADDARLRQRLGEQARRTILDRQLTWDGNAAKIEMLVNSLIEHRQRPPH